MTAPLLAWLLTGAVLTAQTVQPSEVSVRFRTLSFDEPIPKVKFMAGGSVGEFDVPHDKLSAPIAYRGERTVRFLTLDNDVRPAQPPTPELQAATRRQRQAQATTLQISEEIDQTSRLLHGISLQAGESAGGVSPADSLRIQALEARLGQLAELLTAAVTEAEQAGLQILRLEADGRAKAGPVASGKPVVPGRGASPTAEVTFKQDGDYLLIFSSAGAGHQILSLDDRPGLFPPGSSQFLNLTGKKLDIRYPGLKTSVGTNARATIPQPAPDHAYSQAEIHTQVDGDHRLGMVYRSLREPGVRTLVFLLPLPDEPHAIHCRIVEDRAATALTGR